MIDLFLESESDNINGYVNDLFLYFSAEGTFSVNGKLRRLAKIFPDGMETTI